MEANKALDPSGMIDHPAFDPNAIITTEPINELYQIVRLLILVRETGCCFTAHSGVGKTRALIKIQQALREQLPEIVVIRHNTWNQQVSSIRAFYKHFLTAVGHPELRGETFDLRHRLICRLIDMARSSRAPIVVLLIDEANAMRLEDFLFLKDVYNELDKEGVQLITVMMGQDPDFAEVLGILRSRKRLDLISRFARRVVPFRTCSTQKDIRFLLSHYDTARHPNESGPTWTQHFLPHAWENGFRLGDQASNFLRALEQCAPPGRRASGLPSRQLFTVVRRFLIEQMFQDAPGRIIDPSAWDSPMSYAMVSDALSILKTEETRAGDRGDDGV